MPRKRLFTAICAGLLAGAGPMFLAMLSVAQPMNAAEALSDAVGDSATKQQAEQRIYNYLQGHSSTDRWLMVGLGAVQIVVVGGFVLTALPMSHCQQGSTKAITD